MVQSARFWRAEGSRGRLEDRFWDLAGCQPAGHEQRSVGLPTLRTRGPSSLHGWYDLQGSGGPDRTALEAAWRIDSGSRSVAGLQGRCSPGGLGAPRPSTVGASCKVLEQGSVRLSTGRTRGPSSLHGWYDLQGIGGPTAPEAAWRIDFGTSSVARLQSMIRDRQGCSPGGLGAPRPSTVGASCKVLEGRRLRRPLGGSILGPARLPACRA